MNRDLDDLLHRDAALWRCQESGPPSLDDALDSVLQRDSKPLQRFKSVPTAAAVAASILVIAALAVGFGAWRAHRSAQLPAGPGTSYPSTVQYRGKTLYANPGRHIEAVIVDRSRPRKVTVLTDFLDVTGAGACLDAHPVAQVLSQSATTLRLDLITYKRMPPAQLPKSYFCGFTAWGGAAGPPTTRVPLALPMPLGAHAVIRDPDGAPVATIDPTAEPPTPTQLPTGYSPGTVTRADPANDLYAAIRSYRRGANTLVIRAGYLPAGDAATSASHPTIGGNRAELSHGASTSCVSWTNRAGLQLQVCARGTQDTRLSDGQLVNVARSLR